MNFPYRAGILGAAIITVACEASPDAAVDAVERDRESLQVLHEPGASGSGAVNPAAMQVDFYARSPETNDANYPKREVFDHFVGMEVTWR